MFYDDLLSDWEVRAITVYNPRTGEIAGRLLPLPNGDYEVISSSTPMNQRVKSFCEGMSLLNPIEIES